MMQHSKNAALGSITMSELLKRQFERTRLREIDSYPG
jgi:hypothetical protein